MPSSSGRWPRTRCPRRLSSGSWRWRARISSIADPAGAGSAVAEAERIVLRRPGLGVLVEQLTELRRRSAESAHALAGPSTLTPAELRVLPLLSTHLMFEEIAERLHVSRHTVKTQVVSIYGKLDVSSRGEAVDRAIEIGLLEPFPGLRLTARVSGTEPRRLRIARAVRCARRPGCGSIVQDVAGRSRAGHNAATPAPSHGVRVMSLVRGRS